MRRWLLRLKMRFFGWRYVVGFDPAQPGSDAGCFVVMRKNRDGTLTLVDTSFHSTGTDA